MKDRFCGLLLLLAAVIVLSSCGKTKQQEADASNASGYTFTDDLGRMVTVRSHERVAALLGSYADIWVLAGGEICASADDAFEDFGIPLTDGMTDLGGTKSLSLEKLLASAPDFVLASTNTPQHLEWRETLERAGIPVAYFDVSDFSDYLRVLKLCTEITERPERYERYGSALQTEISELLARNQGRDPKKVLVLRVSAASIRAKGSTDTVLGEMLLDFGCVNIADNDRNLLENLSVESILQQDPEYIFLVQVGDDPDGMRANVEQMVREQPLWKSLSAWKNGKVFYMDKQLYNLKPNARWAEAYQKLEEILYAES